MSPLLSTLIAAWLAGVAAFIGGIFARFEVSEDTDSKQELIHGVVAFGGGILVAAVALALVPESMRALSPPMLTLTFCLGGIVFAVLDSFLSRHGGSKAQFMAMLMDFLPEALSLGAIFPDNQRLGILLAVFIGAQNLPEGFNSFREFVKSGTGARTTLAAMAGVSLLGPIAALLGYLVLRGHHQISGGIMSFAAGGILYLIFQDIAPQAKMRRHWLPPLGAVFGFLVGMIGKQLLG
jgi:ZIP family zinc transporter